MAMANYTGLQEMPRPAAPRPRRPKREYEQAETEAIIEGCRRYATSTRKWHDIMKARPRSVLQGTAWVAHARANTGLATCSRGAACRLHGARFDPASDNTKDASAVHTVHQVWESVASASHDIPPSTARSAAG